MIGSEMNRKERFGTSGGNILGYEDKMTVTVLSESSAIDSVSY